MHKKIIILGGSGSGKSTLANRIALHTGYPVYHLDNLFLNSKWEIIDKNKWEEESHQFLSKDVGIIDGNYSSSLPNRIKWADLIIFIDLPTRLQLYRIFRRLFRIRFRLDKRHGTPEGSRENISLKFFLWVYRWNKKRRGRTLSLLELVKDKVVIIKKAKEVDIEKLLKNKKD